MANIRVTLELDDQGYITKIKAADAATNQLGKSAATAGAAGATGMNMLSGAMVGLRAAATAAMTALAPLLAAATAFAAIKSAVTLANDIDDLAVGSGIAAEKIIALRTALRQAGGDSDSAATMITKLTNFLDDAAQGSATAQDTLARLGISLQDIASMTPEQALDATINALAKMEDPVQRNAIAFDLLGKRAANIEWAKVAAGTANVTDAQRRQAEASKKIADVTERLENLFDNMMLTLIELAEPFADLIDRLGSLNNISGISTVIFKGLQVVFATVAVTAYALYTAIDSLIGGLKALYGAGAAALSGEFGKASDILSNYADETKENFADVVDFAKEQYAKIAGIAPPAPAAEGGGGGGGTGGRGGNRGVADPTEKERAKIAAISDAYLEVNKQLRDKLALEYQNLDATDEQIKVAAARLEVSQKAQSEVDKLQEQLNGLDLTKATDQRIAATIRAEIAQIQGLVEAEQDAVEATIRSGERRRREYELNGQKFREVYDLESFKRNIDKQRELESAVTEAQRAEINLRYGIEEEFQKKLLDLKIKYAALGNQVPMEELQRISGERERALANAGQKVAQVAGEEERKRDPKYVIGEWAKALNDLEDPVKKIQSSMDALWGGMTSAIDNFVETGKFKFGDFAKSVIQDLIKIEMKALAVGIFKSVLGSFGIVVPARAQGGPVMGGAPYLVGEKGPELFVPNVSGKIVPNHTLNAGSSMGSDKPTNVTYNIQAVDAPSFQALVARDPQFIYSVSQLGSRSIPR